MKLLKFSISLFALFLFVSCNGQQTKKTEVKTQVNKVIEVIDFHSTHRCFTCNAIESNTKFTLENYFASQMEEGVIVWKVINVDEKENEKIAEKFEAFGTALFINVISDGKETPINMTDFAFENARKKDDFVGILKSKIDEQLKML